MMLVSSDKALVLVLRKPRSKYYTLACFGPKRHYRKDGSCKHTENLLASVRRKYRGRVKVDPWGGNHG